MKTYITIVLVLINIGANFVNSSAIRDQDSVYDKYAVDEDNGVLELISPRPNKPTLREIIYYRVKETPYPSSHISTSDDIPILDVSRPSTNGHGYQYLDNTDNNNSKNDDNTNPNKENVENVETLDGKEDETVEIDVRNGDANEMEKKDTGNTVTEAVKGATDEIVAPEESPALRRRKRYLDYSQLPAAPTLPDFDLRVIPKYLQVLLPDSKENASILDSNFENAMEKQINKLEDIIDAITNVEQPVGSGRTYGMSLTGNSGTVWNDLNKRGFSYNVGNESKTQLQPNKEEFPIDTNIANITKEPETKVPNEIISSLSEIKLLVDELIKEADTLGNITEKDTAAKNNTVYKKETKTDESENIDEHPAKESVDDTENEITIISNTNSDSDFDLDPEDTGNGNETELLESKSPNSDELTNAIMQNINREIDMLRDHVKNDVMGKNYTNIVGFNDVIAKTPKPKDNKINKPKIASKKDELGDIAFEKTKRIDVFDEMINNEKFWQWLKASSKTYMNMMIQNLKPLIKKEVKKQIELFTKGRPEQTTKSPLNSFAKNDYNLTRYDFEDEGYNLTDGLSPKKKNPVAIASSNIYGFVAGTDKVTNFYIFNVDGKNFPNSKRFANITNELLLNANPKPDSNAEETDKGERIKKMKDIINNLLDSLTNENNADDLSSLEGMKTDDKIEKLTDKEVLEAPEKREETNEKFQNENLNKDFDTDNSDSDNLESTTEASPDVYNTILKGETDDKTPESNKNVTSKLADAPNLLQSVKASVKQLLEKFKKKTFADINEKNDAKRNLESLLDMINLNSSITDTQDDMKDTYLDNIGDIKNDGTELEKLNDVKDTELDKIDNQDTGLTKDANKDMELTKDAELPKNDNKDTELAKDQNLDTGLTKVDSKNAELTKDESKDLTKDDTKDTELMKDDAKDTTLTKDDTKDTLLTKDNNKNAELTKDESKDLTKDDTKDIELTKDDSKDTLLTKEDNKDEPLVKDDKKDTELTKEDNKDTELTKDDSKNTDNKISDTTESDVKREVANTDYIDKDKDAKSATEDKNA